MALLFTRDICQCTCPNRQLHIHCCVWRNLLAIASAASSAKENRRERVAVSVSLDTTAEKMRPPTSNRVWSTTPKTAAFCSRLAFLSSSERTTRRASRTATCWWSWPTRAARARSTTSCAFLLTRVRNWFGRFRRICPARTEGKKRLCEKLFILLRKNFVVCFLRKNFVVRFYVIFALLNGIVTLYCSHRPPICVCKSCAVY